MLRLIEIRNGGLITITLTRGKRDGARRKHKKVRCLKNTKQVFSASCYFYSYDRGTFVRTILGYNEEYLP